MHPRPLPVAASLVVAAVALVAVASEARAQAMKGDFELRRAETAIEKKDIEEALRLRQKQIDQETAFQPDRFTILRLDKKVRDEYASVSDGYHDALANGAALEHTRMLEVEDYIRKIRKTVEAAGVFLLLREDDPRFKKFVDPDDYKSKWITGGQRDTRSGIDRLVEGELLRAYDSAWRGWLMLDRAGNADQAFAGLDGARSTLEKLKQNRRGIEKHPAYDRVKETIEERFGAAIDDAVKNAGRSRQTAKEDYQRLVALKGELASFLAASETTPGNLPELEELVTRFDEFSRTTLPEAESFVVAFTSKYGNSNRDVNDRYSAIFGDDQASKPTSVGYDYADVVAKVQAVSERRKEQAAEICKKARVTIRGLSGVTESVRVERLLAQRPRLEIAQRFDPENAEADKLLGELDVKAVELEGAIAEAIKGRKMSPRQFDGDAASLEAEAFEFFENHPDWGARSLRPEKPLVVIVTGNWVVGKRHPISGETLSYKLPIQLAVFRDPFEGWDRERTTVFNLSLISDGPVKEPPFTEVWVGSNFDIAPENVPAQSGGGLRITWLLSCCCCLGVLAGGLGGGFAFLRRQRALAVEAAASSAASEASSPPAADGQA